ncbi:hypothetical protein ACOJB9_08475 [Carnobacterium maltaromaticum]|uniref:hypothetical protein n=1 Tax=Carnobacterium maltaromaticum TaxID=2751 RepID=UPI003C1B1780
MEFNQFVLICMVAFVLFVLLILSIVYRNRPIVKSYDSYLQMREGLAYMRSRGYKAIEIRFTEVVYKWNGEV